MDEHTKILGNLNVALNGVKGLSGLLLMATSGFLGYLNAQGLPVNQEAVKLAIDLAFANTGIRSLEGIFAKAAGPMETIYASRLEKAAETLSGGAAGLVAGTAVGALHTGLIGVIGYGIGYGIGRLMI